MSAARARVYLKGRNLRNCGLNIYVWLLKLCARVIIALVLLNARNSHNDLLLLGKSQSREFSRAAAFSPTIYYHLLNKPPYTVLRARKNLLRIFIFKRNILYTYNCTRAND